MKPNLEEEKLLWKQGYKFVAGLDEAGRGPLAGPVVAGAVLIRAKNCNFLRGINDSKKLSEKQREKFYKILTRPGRPEYPPKVEWGIGVVSEKVIDKINILQATKLAMVRAVRDLDCQTEFLLLDGNFKIDIKEAAFRPEGSPGYGEPRQKSIIKGDQKVISISAASIIAKVTRDRIMEDYDKKYPEYGFKRHKGYPTKFHREKIKELGLCKIHRKSFRTA